MNPAAAALYRDLARAIDSIHGLDVRVERVRELTEALVRLYEAKLREGRA